MVSLEGPRQGIEQLLARIMASEMKARAKMIICKCITMNGIETARTPCCGLLDVRRKGGNFLRRREMPAGI